jgi:serpin B
MKLATAFTYLHLAAFALCAPQPPTTTKTTTASPEVRLEDFLKGKSTEVQNAFLAKSLEALQRAMAEFTQSFYLHMIDTEKSNFVFSPLSLHSALSMLFLGTTSYSDTAKELKTALGRLSSKLNLKAGYHSIIEQYQQEPNFLFGNNFWVQDGFEVNQQFKKTVKDNLNSGIDHIDFSAANSTDIVNEWVRNMTGGRIKKMVDSFSANAVLYLANALYFKEDWLIPFDDTNFHGELLEHDFLTPDGIKKVPMIQQINEFAKYGEIKLFNDQNVDVVTLPYKNELFEMQMIIPKKNMETLENQMKQSNERDIINTSEERYFNLFSHPKNDSLIGNYIDEIYLKMPTFQIKSNLDVVKPLQKLGAKKVFNSGAELGELASGLDNLAVSKITHTALVDVTKEGTEGAAATGAEIVLLSASFSEQKDVVIDRPFIFVVWDRTHKIPVLVGRVMDPTVKIP